MPLQTTIRPIVLDAIERELAHQVSKWGADKQQSLPGYIAIMEYELNEAKHGWMKNLPGRNSALQEIVQVVATGIACLNYYGISGSALSTNDITEKEIIDSRNRTKASA